jgi:hypothetical protein
VSSFRGPFLTLLTEHGAPTAADKRRVSDGIERVQWVAALK